MATARQKTAARKNIRKAQKARRTKSVVKPTAARSKSRVKTTARSRAKTTARPKARTKGRVRTKTVKPRAKSTARRRTKSAARRRGFFHIEVQPREAFVEFKTQDVGSKSGIERIAGKRAGGAWSTQEWLIAKDQAHVERGMLIGDTVDARRVLTMLGSEPRHIKADRFTVHGHSGLPEDVRPTLAPRRAGLTNVQAPQKGRKWS
jgi:hypothetical protein